MRKHMRAAFAVFSIVAWPVALYAQVKFTDPTPAELSMTSEPKAPSAPAIILSYDEEVDPNTAEVIVHVRLKILTSGGLDAGTIEIPERAAEDNDFSSIFAGRTIHPDGSIIRFTGAPENSKSLDNPNGRTRVVAMPAITVGSILEYGYHLRSVIYFATYLSNYYLPIWHVQQAWFVRNAHFALRFPESHTEGMSYYTEDKESVHWVANLPQGAEISRGKGRYELGLSDIPAQDREDFMPPPNSMFYNVKFFYYKDKQDNYWGESGSRVDEAWHNFDRPSKLLKDAVSEIVLPGDNDETKLHKLYLAVQKLDNTDLSREHSQHEDKVSGQKTAANADTIWTNRRGAADDLALLFVALARSAGYSAYPMAVASRNFQIFEKNVHSWDQLNDIVAIVNVNGKELFFDPGTRLCPFGQMAPWHANVVGISTEAKAWKIRSTPVQSYQSNHTERASDLMLTSDGQVTGTVKVSWLGTAGLALRRVALREDDKAAETQAELELQHLLLPGVVVKLDTLTGLKDSESPLTASFTINGRLGPATSKRVIIPAQFFASNSPRIFAEEKRTQPIAFPQAYVVHDRVIVHLPVGFAVEELPKAHKMVLGVDEGSYETQIQTGTMQNAPDVRVLQIQRNMMLNRLDYKAEDYGPLQKYFAAISSADSEQITLKPASAAPSGAGAATSPAPPSPSR